MRKSIVNLFLLAIFICINSACMDRNNIEISWENSITLPGCKEMQKNVGLAGVYSGIIGNKILILGGANFPDKYPWEGGKKVWWPTLYSYNPDNNEWTVHDDFLPSPLAYGVSIQLPEGLLCIGGCNKNQCSNQVLLIKENNQSFTIDSISYPPLPVPLANAAGALTGNKIYIAGGQETMINESSTKHFFMLDLNQKDKGWQKMPDIPGLSRAYAVCAAQNGNVYLFSGRNFGPDQEMVVLADGLVFETETGKWKKIPGNYPVMAGTAIPYKQDKIILLGGVERILPASPEHPGFSRKARVFDTNANTMGLPINSPYPIPVTTHTVCDKNTFYITSGEIQPGIRTPHLLKGNIKSE